MPWSFTPLPRKGTETIAVVTTSPRMRGRSFTPLPRKGTETVLWGVNYGRVGEPKLSRHYPARGRKLLLQRLAGNQKANSFTPLPRKGTETFLGVMLAGQSVNYLSRHYPARGRKPSTGNNDNCVFINFHAITPQGDGNCHLWNIQQRPRNRFHAITPQGDGNPCRSGKIGSSTLWAFTPLPRKGTETLSAPSHR